MDRIRCIYVKRYQSNRVNGKLASGKKTVFNLTKIDIPKYIKFLRKVNKNALLGYKMLINLRSLYNLFFTCW